MVLVMVTVHTPVGMRCLPTQLSHHTVDIIKSLDATFANKTNAEKYSTIVRSMKYVFRFAYWQEVTVSESYGRVGAGQYNIP